MSNLGIVGLIVLLIGVFLIGYGIRASQTITDKVVSGVTGRYTRHTMWYLLGGALLLVIGLGLLFL
jgi:hypothetical protein